MSKPKPHSRDTALHPRSACDLKPDTRACWRLIRSSAVSGSSSRSSTSQAPPEGKLDAMTAPHHESCPYGNMPRSAGSGHWSEWHRGHGCHLDPDHKRDTICELLRQLGRKHPDQRLGQLIANVLDPGWELRHSLSRIEDDIIERKLRAAIEHGIEAAWRTR